MYLLQVGWIEQPVGPIHGHVIYVSTRPFDNPQLLLQAKWEPLVANVCSWAVAVVVAYGLHSAFTFEIKISLNSFARYVAVCLSTLILGTALLAIFSAFVPVLTAKVASTIVVFTASFALSHLTVFRAA